MFYSIALIIAILCCLLIIAFIIVPVAFKYSVTFQRMLMFTNMGLSDNPLDYESPFQGIRNIYHTIDHPDESVTLGIWHVLPTELENELDFDKALATSNYSTIIHFHGSGETRTDSKGTFAVLKDYFHVIAVEYRGFGDSSKVLLSEEGISKDFVEIYKWIRAKTNNHIYIWGHSLGTALSALTITKLKKERLMPMGLILEAPLTSMAEEIPVHPYGRLFAWLPWFENTIVSPLERNGFFFNTSNSIVDVDCPVMILHAEDDSVIPYTLGKKLSELAKNARKPNQGNITYYQFSPFWELDHFRIFRYPFLPFLLEKFIKTCNFYSKERPPIRRKLKKTH